LCAKLIDTEKEEDAAENIQDRPHNYVRQFEGARVAQM